MNYNRVAWFYDVLSRAVFGNAIIKAQTLYLPLINFGDNVLIVGGGTGKILEWLASIHPSGLNIHYVEASDEMIRMAKKKWTVENNVIFINCPIEEFVFNNKFDVVITFFLFDNFLEADTELIFTHIDRYLKPGSIWLYSDFQLSGKLWQKGLLSFMFLFFNLVCNVKAKKLPDLENIFNQNKYSLKKQRNFYKGFITSRVYANPSNNEAF